MLRVLSCMILLVGGCASRISPASNPSECEQLLKATIIDSIERDAKSKADVARARAGEKIARGHEKAAEDELNEAKWWRQYGPMLLVFTIAGGFAAGSAFGFGVKR